MDEDYKADLEAEIKRADVVVMIYSVESVDSILNIYNSWLPKVRGLLGERSKVRHYCVSCLLTFITGCAGTLSGQQS